MSDEITVIIIAVILLFTVLIIIKLIKHFIEITYKLPYRKKEYLLTQAENSFFSVLKFDENGKIPVVMTHLYNGKEGYFLLGGGIDNDEDHSQCIITIQYQPTS